MSIRLNLSAKLEKLWKTLGNHPGLVYLNHECALASLDRAASGKMMRGRVMKHGGKKPAGGH